MNHLTLSIIVPCFNERATVGTLLRRLSGMNLGDTAIEVLAVDDGSTDGSWEAMAEAVLEAGGSLVDETAAAGDGTAPSSRAKPSAAAADDLAAADGVDGAGRQGGAAKVIGIRRLTNGGKGEAIKTAHRCGSGQAIVVQDADTEYDPDDIPALVEAYRRHQGQAAVYGSRNANGQNRSSYRSYYLGGRALTAFANLLYGLRLTDALTGYKLVPRRAIEDMDLASRRFEFCAEVTAKLARMGIAVVEVPISYRPRRFLDGKKIRVSDGWHLLREFWRWRRWS